MLVWPAAGSMWAEPALERVPASPLISSSSETVWEAVDFEAPYVLPGPPAADGLGLVYAVGFSVRPSRFPGGRGPTLDALVVVGTSVRGLTEVERSGSGYGGCGSRVRPVWARNPWMSSGRY